jgi:hypothetical protein
METSFEQREKQLLQEFEKEDPILWNQKYYNDTVIFLNIYRTSLFTNVFGMVEYELKKACNFHFRNNKTIVSMNDLRGNSEFERAKNYLTKICKINFDSLNTEWNYLQTVKDLRNILIHNQGEFVQTNEKKTKKLIKFIREKDYLEFKPNESIDEEEYFSNDGKIIVTNKRFNEELIDTADIFFTKLLEMNL